MLELELVLDYQRSCGEAFDSVRSGVVRRLRFAVIQMTRLQTQGKQAVIVLASLVFRDLIPYL